MDWHVLSRRSRFLLACEYLLAKNARIGVLALLLLSAQLAIFVLQLVETDPPSPSRLLQVAIAISYAVAAMTTLFTLARVTEPLHGLLMLSSVSLVFFSSSGFWRAPS